MITKIQRDIHPNFNGEFIEDTITTVIVLTDQGPDIVSRKFETKKLSPIITENFLPFQGSMHYKEHVTNIEDMFYGFCQWKPNVKDVELEGVNEDNLNYILEILDNDC